MEHESVFERMRRAVRGHLQHDPPTEAPTFAPTDPPETRAAVRSLDIGGGAISLKTGAVPENVRQQLARYRIPLEWYDEHELQAAIRDCAVDCTLNDEDDESPGFIYTADDKKLNHAARTMRVLGVETFGVAEHEEDSFVSRLRAERMRDFARQQSGGGLESMSLAL